MAKSPYVSSLGAKEFASSKVTYHISSILVLLLLSLLTACTSKSIYRSLGLEGGTISAQGASLTIPKGQLSSPLEVRIEKKTRSHQDLPSPPPGLEARSALFLFETKSEARARARVQLPLSASVERGEALDLYRWQDNRWERLGGAMPEPDGGAAEAEVSSFPIAVALFQAAPTKPVISGWLPLGDVAPPWAEEALEAINPLAYQPGADGTLSTTSQPLPKAKKAKVIPTIYNWGGAGRDSGDMNKILASDLLRSRHVAAIAAMARDQGYPGVDVDYRGIDPSLRDKFTQFVTELARELHTDKRSLSLTLPLPEKRQDGWDTGAYHWLELGRAADLLRLLPERDPSLYPSRMEEVLAYATSQVDGRKLQLVLSTLSHQKTSQGMADITLTEALRIAGEIAQKQPTPVLPGDTLTLYAPNLLPDAGASGLSWSEQAASVTFSYTTDGKPVTVWIENPFSIAFKLKLAERFGLGGVAVERLGGELRDEAIWNVISAYAATGKVTPAKPNPAMMGLRWQSSDGSLKEQEGAWVNWRVPEAAGEYLVSALVGDGSSWARSSLSFQVQPASTPELVLRPTPSPTPRPSPTPSLPPATTPLPSPTPPLPSPTTPAPTPTPPPASPPSGPARYPGVGYGMQVAPENDLNRALGLLTAAGFGWAKVQLRWEDLESQRGSINWGLIDSVVNTANARGVRLLVSVVTAPKWSRPADTDFSVPGPPANLKDFADFVGALAARHKGKIHAYEVWNEQNLWYEWGGRGRKLNAAQYVELLRYAYQAIKAADPDAVVLSGAPTPTGINDGDTAYDDAAYLQMMYEAGLKNYSDAVAAHPSGYNNPPDDDPSNNSTRTTTFKGHWSFYYRRFEQFHDIMAQFGDGDKQIWFTEFGWASSSDPFPEYAYAKDNSEQDQARYLVRAYQIAKQKGYVGVMFVWNLNYAPIAEPNDRYAKRAFSIIRPDWTPRPAYDALAAMPK